MKKKMVRNFNEFKANNWYIYTGVHYDAWNSNKGMNFALSRKPVQCITGDGKEASFRNVIPVPDPDLGHVNFLWNWTSGFDDWIEIKDPKINKITLYTGDKFYNAARNTVFTEGGDKFNFQRKKAPFLYGLTKRILIKENDNEGNIKTAVIDNVGDFMKTFTKMKTYSAPVYPGFWDDIAMLKSGIQKEALARKVEELEELETQNDDLRDEIRTRDEDIEYLKSEADNHVERIEELEREVDENCDLLGKRARKIYKLEAKLEKLKSPQIPSGRMWDRKELKNWSRDELEIKIMHLADRIILSDDARKMVKDENESLKNTIESLPNSDDIKMTIIKDRKFEEENKELKKLLVYFLNCK